MVETRVSSQLFAHFIHTLRTGHKNTSANIECKNINLGYIFVVISSELKDRFVKKL